MTDKEIKDIVEDIKFDAANIPDPMMQRSFSASLNLNESFYKENKLLRTKIQHLEDEIANLKGEQGKPDIKANKNKNKDGNISSETERKKRLTTSSKKKKKKKKSKLKIHETRNCSIDKNTLPKDAALQGHVPEIVQDIIIKEHNIKFLREIYYSPSLKQTFIADVPVGWEGDFSPNIKALVLTLHHDSMMSQSAIESFFKTHKIDISETTISRIISEKYTDVFCREQLDIVKAGLQSTTYQQIDDTGSRVNGKNCYTHILCNPFYTAYFTRPNKNRMTVLELITGNNIEYLANEEAYLLMKQFKLAGKWIDVLKAENFYGSLSKENIDQILLKIFPDQNKYRKNRKTIIEACAIASYRQKLDAIAILICDDAGQFKFITEYLGLCWVHEGRHYKKLTPIFQWHKKILVEFISDFWDFYVKLIEYKAHPSESSAACISKEFDNLFKKTTHYSDLDERIQTTYTKKEQLLLVLKYPYIPLHNNASEQGVRREKRKSDISFQTRSSNGTKAKDAGMTIVETARKHGINTYKYFIEMITKQSDRKRLSELILQAAYST